MLTQIPHTLPIPLATKCSIFYHIPMVQAANLSWSTDCAVPPFSQTKITKLSNSFEKTKLFYHSSGNEGISIIPNTVHAVLDAEYEPGREDLRLHSVRWNRYDRTTYTFLKLPSILERWYDAARKWNEILKRPENEYWEQLRPGRPLSKFAFLSMK